MSRPDPRLNFNRIARPYRWLEYLSLGISLTRCRTHFLPELARCRSALILGDGDGRFTARFLATYPHLRADAVDISEGMLALLAQRTCAAHPTAASRLATHQISALHFTPVRSYDVVVSHFFLDCLTQLEMETLVTRIKPHLVPDALWVFSDFRVPSGPVRLFARILVRSLYLAFRILTGLQTTRLPDHDSALRAAGFRRLARHLSLAGILTAELWLYPSDSEAAYSPSMQLPPQRPKSPHVPDALSDPEPAGPSLPEPDPGVFHREPGTSPPPEQNPS